MSVNICIDIGGTNTRVGYISKNKLTIISVFKTKSDPSLNFEAILNIIDEYNYDAIAISTAGPIDLETFVYGDLPNLKQWKHFDLKANFIDKVKRRVYVENDANCAILYECNNYRDALFFTISTGFGGGAKSNGSLVRGADNKAMDVFAFEFEDGSSLEAHCSGQGIFKTAKFQGAQVTCTADVFAKYGSCKICKATIDNGLEKTIYFLKNSLIYINPQVVVLGGSVIENNLWYFKEIKKQLEEVKYHRVEVKLAKEPKYNTLFGANELIE